MVHILGNTPPKPTVKQELRKTQAVLAVYKERYRFAGQAVQFLCQLLDQHGVSAALYEQKVKDISDGKIVVDDKALSN